MTDAGFSAKLSIFVTGLTQISLNIRRGGNNMLQIDIEEKDRVAIISVNGELSLHSVDGFENAFKKYPASDFNVIALDMKHMPYIDSFGMSRMIKISRIFTATGKEFVIVNMNDNIYQIFKMSTFDRFFNIMTGEEFELEYLTPEIPVRSYSMDYVEEFADLHESKIKQVELVDDNGTTLVFLEE
jgi:anti-anti-sigma factor